MPSVVVLGLAFLSVAATPPARMPADRLTAPKLVLASAGAVRPSRARFLNESLSRTSKPTPARIKKKRSMAPVVGGMLLGALGGFVAGNYVQHSVREYDCGAGGFTWGFTVAGAAGGAAIGWLFRQR